MHSPVGQLAKYCVDLTLQEYDMRKYAPTTIAAAALHLALKTMGMRPSVAELKLQAQTNLAQCIHDMLILQKGACHNNLKAVFDFYSTDTAFFVSSIKALDHS
mmetsp:Transcript_1097/g.1845  ORF Transcript_1097/g.1845 Transcript_1097/m.1845 type:complete len:103 (+) Transcript_1097:1-309(+)